MGRPKKPAGEAKTLVIPVRLTVAQRDQIREAAHHEHLEVSGWIRKTILDAAAAVNERAAAKRAVKK
jgi:uncharacterized protein (DUF1778 family)